MLVGADPRASRAEWQPISHTLAPYQNVLTSSGHQVHNPSQEQRTSWEERHGSKASFDKELYKLRNVVERLFNRLKQFRRIATRYEKRAHNYKAMLIVASILLWL